MACLTGTVHNGRDDTLVWLLTSNDAPIADLSGITRVVLHLDGSTSVDSDVAGSSVIWWTDTATYRGATYDVLSLRLGGQSLTAGTYSDCELVVYDADHTNGETYDAIDIALTVVA